MMKYFWSILIIVFALISCKSDDESLQRIDQVMNIYMKSNTNPDLLNAKKSGSYTAYSVNDMLGDRDISPVSIPLKMRPDSTFYMEYISGAKRRKLDSAGTMYYSRMRLTLSRNVNNAPENTFDTLEIRYRNSLEVFQVSQVLYNRKLMFSKEAGAANSINEVTIVK
ncbi:hypothetical protein EGY05_20460 [Chryseobacterium arthrosphaerae]|uniref:Uncharacterized protein n=1 Tax=Chryseobacterium arthrosphaerae TaxID=651561 RepID=A0A432E168_9FLAO|nr:hypothetical protein [Chryseobacterium arthrosphaerae]AYZ14165.1 hypothetical protein EGY05_20460 [Chryseobacterium arthrosphaerae]RTZ50158.1 hypothetical protein EJ377_09320 [Chryseobacterium arthrosphaerae]WES96136.1 hypothetical protein P2W68_14890 [Chryseobacterium arthrosphaerae]